MKPADSSSESQPTRSAPAPYVAPALVWEQEFVALAQGSVTDPCAGVPPGSVEGC